MNVIMDDSHIVLEPQTNHQTAIACSPFGTMMVEHKDATSGNDVNEKPGDVLTTQPITSKARHVHFDDSCLTTVHSIESRHDYTAAERIAVWMQAADIAETVRDIPDTLDHCFEAASAVAAAIYTQSLADTYLKCCNLLLEGETSSNNNENMEDESLVVQRMQEQIVALARGGRGIEDEEDNHHSITRISSPLQDLRGLETQVLPELANERSRRRSEHVASLSQLHPLVRGQTSAEIMIAAVSQRLSRPSRRFAAVLGAMDAEIVQLLQHDTASTPVTPRTETELLAELTLEHRGEETQSCNLRKRRSSDFDVAVAQAHAIDKMTTTAMLPDPVLPILPSRKQQKRKAFVPPSA